MTTNKIRLAALAAAMIMSASLIGCSSKASDSGSDTAASTGGTTASEKTWCTSVRNLIDQSGTDALSVSGNLASLSQAMVALSSTAPSAIATDMQTLATVSSAAVQLNQANPGSTLPQEARQQASTAWNNMDAWVTANCGIDVPALAP